MGTVGLQFGENARKVIDRIKLPEYWAIRMTLIDATSYPPFGSHEFYGFPKSTSGY